MFPFLAFFAISLELVVRTESVRQRNHWFVTKRVFFDNFVTKSMFSFSQFFDSVRRTNFNEMAINATQKKDKVQNENHCTKKI